MQSKFILSAGILAMFTTAVQADFKFYGREFTGKAGGYTYSLIACSELETRENCLMYTKATAGTTNQLPSEVISFKTICEKPNLELRKSGTSYWAVYDEGNKEIAKCDPFEHEVLGPYENKSGKFKGDSRLLCKSDLCGKIQ
ncbi:hypothetical protein F5B20DRAFT_555969 [Whalleya microplaca]|nr:hypothetical protein F5B20DRAFT_555969 [Whalleya microplaca]